MSATYCFTLEDVSKHNGTGDAGTWIAIKDIVYDVTAYMEEHPGGSELLMEYAGKDATSGFQDFGHSSDAKNLLKTYRIGELVESDRIANRNKKNKIKSQDLNFNNKSTKPQTRSHSINRPPSERKICF